MNGVVANRLKPYPAYKDSGVEWLGEVPEHWEVRRGKQIFRCINVRSNTGQEELLTVSSNHGVVSRQSVNVTMFKAESYIGYKLCWPKDLVINSLWAWARGLGVSERHGIISGAYGVYRPNQFAKPKFIHLLVRSMPFQWELRVRSKGIWISRLQLTDDAFLCASLPLPPLPEQTAIVRYLDYVDRRVQRLTQAKQKLVALLKEQKQVIIHRTVTRGLDLDVPMKDSGIEWLGEVPAHWEVVPVKRNYEIQLGKMLQNKPDSPSDIEVPYLKAQHVQWFAVNAGSAPKMWASPHDVEQFGIATGDLLVCEGGEGGRSGIVRDILHGFIIQNALHRVRSHDNCLNTYLLYLMNSVSATGWFDAVSNKATIAHFTREKFGSLMMPLPPLPEQTAIAKYLDKVTADIDVAIDRTRRWVELLNEYRTRLIADVVTGKLDVRETATRLPVEPDKPGKIAEKCT